ncbi:hypothetical protein SUGI_1190730 [Cryptomeria japonica]|uniref:brassinosteroid-responsive RING protein 1 n=1 Tax=Cryptomeria japonica TaxID=3369 RepID=UPI002414BF77|nr:brassinosteroid-responsive RING protein 1 [Cryptomeria japonica]GLJ55453.1 hypothetical protein SUGI_1190730 [Cryptomeria japonica]
MGFPAGYCAPLIPTFLFKLLSELRNTICSLLSWQESSDSPSSTISPVFTDKILEILPVIVFRDFAEMEEDVACSVCLGSFEKDDEIRELCNCCHIFHRKCLDHWICHRQQTCPLCRRSLLPQMEEQEEEDNSNGWIVDQICYLLGQDLIVSGAQ